VNGSLVSPSTFTHAGLGGSYFWADPEAELVGVYLSASSRDDHGWTVMHSDQFVNAVHAAVVE
jgi:CubicO group peptidase (beta-lactamase class C family)